MNHQDLEDNRNINPLFIKKKVYKFGEESILNKEENPVFKLKRNVYLPIDFLELQSKSQKRLYSLLEKRFSFTRLYFLINSRGKTLGTFKTPLFTSQTDHALFNSQDEKILETFNFSNFNQFSIKTSNGNKLVAKIKAPHKYIKQNPSLKDYLCVFFSPDTTPINKLKIICFILYIRQITKNGDGVSNITGFARRLARLRPFGPSKMDH